MITLKKRIGILKSSAKRRQIEVRLMDYEYENLLRLGCHYCGKSVLDEKGVNLDRLDSNRGYTLYNCVPCCKICNIAKNTLTFNEFVDWVFKAQSHMKAIMDYLKTTPEHEYSYKEEKDLHKSLNQVGTKNIIKVK